MVREERSTDEVVTSFRNVGAEEVGTFVRQVEFDRTSRVDTSFRHVEAEAEVITLRWTCRRHGHLLLSLPRSKRRVRGPNQCILLTREDGVYQHPPFRNDLS